MPERAHPEDPLWQKTCGILSTPARNNLEWRYRQCRPFVRDRVVLDVPCGTGMGFPFLGQARQLFGADLSQEALQVARTRFGKYVADLKCCPMQKLEFGDRSLDVVVCLEGIEHLTKEDGVVFLGEVTRVLRPGGLLLLSWPAMVDGRHSENEFHLYEWPEKEMVEILGGAFELVEHKVRRRFGLEIWFVAARLKQGDAVSRVLRERMDGQRARRISDAGGKVAEWVRQRWMGEKAAYTKESPPTLMATCFAVLAEECLGTLSAWPRQRRQSVASFLKSQQSATNGLFDAASVRREDCDWTSHCDPEYIRLQLTYFSLAALHALQETPSHPLAFARRFLDPHFALGWVDGGPWDNPWNQSNRVMFLLRFLIHLATEEHENSAWPIFDRILDNLIERQSRETGLWHGTSNASVREAVFAGYHFFPFFFWRKRLVPHAERIIDSTLAVQHADGLFGAGQGGGACEDLDAIDTLVKFSLVTDHRAAEVRKALVRALDRLLLLQNSDGGFPDQPLQVGDLHRSLRRRVADGLGVTRVLKRPLLLPRIYYSGWQTMGAAKGGSTMWAAWFRPLAVRLILSRYPDLTDSRMEGRFHGLPCLGWHDPDMAKLPAKA